MSFRIDILIDAQATLGECPRYDDRDQSLWYVDIVAKTIYRMDWQSKEIVSRQFDEEVGCFGFCADGGMVFGMQTGFYYAAKPLSSELVFLTNPEADRPWQRMNDGRCGPDGLFYAGSVNPKKEAASAALYQLKGRETTVIDDGFLTFNGLVFDSNNKRIIYADTPQHQMYEAQWSAESGAIDNRRVFAEFANGRGRPDGACLDAKGNIWTALYDGHAIVKLSGDGVSIDRIPIPCKHPTALTFAGPKLDQLIVTTARQGHSELDLAMYPKAGAVFIIDIESKGAPEHLIDSY